MGRRNNFDHGERSVKSSVIVLLVLSGMRPTSAADARQTVGGGAPLNPVEEIYVARSLREGRSTPTEFCAQARIGFGAAVEDRYTFRSIATRPTDGRMVDANMTTIGSLRACIGTTADVARLKFYAEGVLGGIPFTANGDCRTSKQDYPEPGITAAVCAFDLRDLPTGYVGGQLTSNTVSSEI
jgi:hypothetical protein